MPKRKSSRSREEDIDHYKHKIRKLERKIRERQISESKDGSDPEEVIECIVEDEAATPALRPDDWLLQWPEYENADNVIETLEPQAGLNEAPEENEHAADLDTEILAILGDEPASTDKRGPKIRDELASRILHITKEGLSKENRKELLSKYPVPTNCVEIDAPKINPEIKAAITDAAMKRDKGIETKQKQMSSAITCLSEVINTHINSKSKDNDMLQKLMDTTKILCDLQHADSITRKNFVLFSLKNDMKEHLKNTKIDSFLFGEDLSETLKAAKAVNKSGVELKSEAFNKPVITYKGTAPRPLNRKAPPQARRQPAGQAPPAPRTREPAAARAPYRPPRSQYHPPPPHAQSSRTSSQAQYQGRRRY